MNGNIWEILVVGLVLLCLVISVVAILSIRQNKEQVMQCIGLIGDLHKENEANKAKIFGFEKQLASLQKQIEKHQSGIDGLSEKMLQCEDNIDRLFEQDPALKMYAKASKLVAAGESIEDIIDASGLPRAEVEVLFSLHRKQK